jgi:predicted RNA-binding protein with TRAM domain
MDGNRGRPTPPVNVGDEIDVKIEAVGEKGDGIAKKDGFVLFIPGVKEGDEVKVRVTKVLRRVGFAEVVGEGAAPAEDAPADEAAEEQPAEEAPAEEPEASPEDSESFGEEEAKEEEPEAEMPAIPEEESEKSEEAEEPAAEESTEEKKE